MTVNPDSNDLSESKKTDERGSGDGGKTLGLKVFDFVKEIVILVATAFVVAFLIKTFLVQPFKIEQQSMVPTLYPNERVLVNKFIYYFQEPEQGDIITFKDFYAPEQSRVLIKRIIATEGDTIEISKGKVMVDGEQIKEPYLIPLKDSSNYRSRRIPKDSVFVMGDNRPNSGDSRAFGPVHEKQILGKAFFIYWPIKRIGLIPAD